MGGETLGFPNWFPFPQGNIWGALLPIDPGCEFGPCVPLPSGYATGISGKGTPESPFTISVYVWAGMHLCGEWLCDEHGNFVRPAPREIQGMSEDVAVELALAGGITKGASWVANTVLWNFGYHIKPHPIWWLGGARLAHYQLNVWLNGVKGSDIRFRIPWWSR